MITIPQYVQRFIDASLNLNTTNKICCLFHEEETPSMVYSPDKRILTCFGACHKSWKNAVSIHQDLNNFNSYEEALEDLALKLGLEDPALLRVQPILTITEDEMEQSDIMQQCYYLAKDNVEFYLDYARILNQYPRNYTKLKELITKYKGVNK